MKDRGRRIHGDQCIGVGMLVVRRESLLLAGGFPELDYAEEFALVEHLVARGVRQGRLDERSCVYHRNHPDSITRQRQGVDAG